MNKYLVDFIDDELKNNGYYEHIRKFAEEKEWKYILSDVVEEYDNNIDNFGPYRFMDAIEDFLCKLYENNDKLVETADYLSEIIDRAWDEDFFELY